MKYEKFREICGEDVSFIDPYCRPGCDLMIRAYIVNELNVHRRAIGNKLNHSNIKYNPLEDTTDLTELVNSFYEDVYDGGFNSIIFERVEELINENKI